MENCPFCEIISGEYKASFAHRDQNLVAFLDIHPVNEGHMLIVPIKHVERMSDLDDETAAAMFVLANRIARSIYQSALPCEGINFMLSDGKIAGQDVPHCHMHVAPRLTGDSLIIKHDYGTWDDSRRQRFDEIAAMISEGLLKG